MSDEPLTQVVVDRESVIKALELISPEKIAAARMYTSKRFANMAVAVIRRNVPKKTGNLQRSIHRLDRGFDAVVQADARYARFVDEGTGLYGPRGARIYPTHARALAWPAGVAGGPALRLTGSPRSGSSGGKMVRRSIAGMRPRHFMARSAAQIDAATPATLDACAAAFLEPIVPPAPAA